MNMNLFNSDPFKLRHSYLPEHPTEGGLSSPDEVPISRNDHFSLFFVVFWKVRGLPVGNDGGEDYWSKNEHTFVVITF